MRAHHKLCLFNVLLLCLMLCGCTRQTTFVGFELLSPLNPEESVRCGFEERFLDPDADAFTAVTNALDRLANRGADAAGPIPSMPQAPLSEGETRTHVSALVQTCTAAKTCVYWNGESCTVIRGGRE